MLVRKQYSQWVRSIVFSGAERFPEQVDRHGVLADETGKVESTRRELRIVSGDNGRYRLLRATRVVLLGKQPPALEQSFLQGSPVA
jgi:hypothetical protein